MAPTPEDLKRMYTYFDIKEEYQVTSVRNHEDYQSINLAKVKKSGEIRYMSDDEVYVVPGFNYEKDQILDEIPENATLESEFNALERKKNLAIIKLEGNPDNMTLFTNLTRKNRLCSIREILTLAMANPWNLIILPDMENVFIPELIKICGNGNYKVIINEKTYSGDDLNTPILDLYTQYTDSETEEIKYMLHIDVYSLS